MIRSDELGELAAALCAFQGAVEAVPKDSNNPFFKSKFAGLPAVVAAATPLLLANGLAVTQHLGHDEGGDTLTTMVLHKSGQFIGDTMRLMLVPDNKGKFTPQAQGSSTTYGRRYAYMAALGLVADEDDDGNHASGKAKAGAANGHTVTARRPQPTEEAVNPAQRRMLFAKAKEAGLGENDIKAVLLLVHPDGHGHSDRLPKSKLDVVLEQFQAIGNGAMA